MCPRCLKYMIQAQEMVEKPLLEQSTCEKMTTYLFYEFKILLDANKSLGVTINTGISLINESITICSPFGSKTMKVCYLAPNLCEIVRSGRKAIKEMET